MCSRCGPAWNELGVLHSRHGRFGEAEAAYERAIATEPGFAAAYYNLAILFADAGIFGEAINEWQKAADIDPNTDLGARSIDNIGIIKEMQRAEMPQLDG